MVVDQGTRSDQSENRLFPMKRREAEVEDKRIDAVDYGETVADTVKFAAITAILTARFQ